MSLTREAVRAAVERAGEEHWRTLVRHHEDAYPASRPTPGEVCRQEAERLNQAGYGDPARYELMRTTVTAAGDQVTLVHRLLDRPAGKELELPPYTNYA